MDETELSERLTRFCRGRLGYGAEVVRLRQLTGGASQQTWAFDFVGHEFILRRSAGQDSVAVQQGLLTARREAELIRLMSATGVRVPEICGELTKEDGLGSGFIMSRVAGEALPQKLFRDPEYMAALDLFPDECARQLALIHAADASLIEGAIPVRTPKERVAQLIARYEAFATPLPVLAMALRWLQDNVPTETCRTIVHGDFRMGNLLLGPDRINAVLDWELAHLGDPVFDLAYLCAPCWRFGRYQNPVGGAGQIEDLLSAYERHGGTIIDRDRFCFWLVYTSAWWAITCLVMFSAWRTGEVRTLERVIIGTRASENDIDLLLLLSEIGAFQPEHPLAWPGDEDPVTVAASQSSEIAEAVGEWVTDRLIPDLDGAGLFEARVARNALGILARRNGLGRVFEVRAADRYAALGLTPQTLAGQLFKHASFAQSPGIAKHLQLSAIETLMTDQPKYAGLAAAKNAWT